MSQLGLPGMPAANQEREPDTAEKRVPRPEAHEHLGLPSKCPRKGCGLPLQWYEVGASNGLDPSWLDSWIVDCSCGLNLYVEPDGQASLWPKDEPKRKAEA